MVEARWRNDDDPVAVRREPEGGGEEREDCGTRGNKRRKKEMRLFLMVCKQICVGRWIYREMRRCVHNKKVEIFFPHLVIELCRRAKVPMCKNEKFMKATRSIIRDSLYTQALNYPPDTFGQMHTHHEDEEEEPTLENESEKDLPSEEDNYEAAFQPQYSTPKGLVIQSLTHHAPSMGGSSHQEYGFEKVKALMKRRRFPCWDDSAED
ncbi:hypothetical protein Gohar_004604 [Gossypium harknessii]|uniref:Uncharacterized protein n=1 Tax=Gossypium harknessii TaxID=34285 RepID=A0A7J9H5G9_9ROSI|nr:hypothetical protein [Gossypium harknessii]